MRLKKIIEWDLEILIKHYIISLAENISSQMSEFW